MSEPIFVKDSKTNQTHFYLKQSADIFSRCSTFLSLLFSFFFLILKAVAQHWRQLSHRLMMAAAARCSLSDQSLLKVTGCLFPFSCKDGVFRRYQGARTKDDFLSFIHDQKWKSLEPVSSWFGPSSFLWVPVMLVASVGTKSLKRVTEMTSYWSEQLSVVVAAAVQTLK